MTSRLLNATRVVISWLSKPSEWGIRVPNLVVCTNEDDLVLNDLFGGKCRRLSIHSGGLRQSIQAGSGSNPSSMEFSGSRGSGRPRALAIGCAKWPFVASMSAW